MSARRRRRLLQIVILAVPAALLGWWLLRPHPTEEELILDLVAKAEHGVETKDRGEIMECVADDYRDDEGLTRVDILRLALHWERSPEQVEVTIDEYELDIASPTAVGHFAVELDFQQAPGREPHLRLPLVVTFEKRRRGWHKVWLVKSVSGHGIEQRFEDLY